jgi:hypothetical protein
VKLEKYVVYGPDSVKVLPTDSAKSNIQPGWTIRMSLVLGSSEESRVSREPGFWRPPYNPSDQDKALEDEYEPWSGDTKETSQDWISLQKSLSNGYYVVFNDVAGQFANQTCMRGLYQENLFAFRLTEYQQ